MKRLKKQALTVNNLQVAYYQGGQGVPLLFLHGSFIRARTCGRALDLLARRYTVIALDIPAYGSSDTPQTDWSYVEYAAFLDAFLQELGLDTVVVAGYSMGGAIAFHLAAVSKRVRKLVLIDAAGIHGNVRKRRQNERQLKFYLTHPAYWAALAILSRDITQFTMKHLFDYQHMRRIRIACFNSPNEEALRRITVPTTLIWARDDWNIPIAKAYEFQKRIPQAKLEVVPGIHDWLIYDPKRLLEVDGM